jgi:hypothetical protein
MDQVRALLRTAAQVWLIDHPWIEAEHPDGYATSENRFVAEAEQAWFDEVKART